MIVRSDGAPSWTPEDGTAVAAPALRAPVGAAQRPGGSSAWVGWLAMAVVAVLPLAEAVRILVWRPHVVLDGDEALLDLGARRAGHLLQLVGPYSRVGFHQPGPAVFYLLAPFVRLLGSSGAGLFLGAIVISGAALIATVAFLWRRVGATAALWAAAVIDLYCLCLQVGTLREPWNPYLVVTPMVLFVVLWAAGITGAPGAGLWAVVIGSYEVQTHIATAGFVVVMSVILVVRMALNTGRGKGNGAARHYSWGPARMVGSGALVLIWLPPTVELGRDHPNNVVVLWDYFTASHATPSVHQALEVAGNALTILPFGYHDYALALSRSPAQLAAGAGLMALGLVVAVVLGVRRHQPLSLALAASALLGVVIGTLSLLVAAAPLYLYFAVWLAFVPLSLLLAIGNALLAPSATSGHPPFGSHPRREAQPIASAARRWLVGCAVAAVAIAAVTVTSDLRMASITTSTGAGPWPQAADGSRQARSRAVPDTASLTTAAERVLQPSDRRVGFDLGPTSPWPYVAGMVLALDERGVQSTVSPASWELYFGHERAPGRPVTVQFHIFAMNAPAAVRAGAGTTIDVVDGYVLTFQR